MLETCLLEKVVLLNTFQTLPTVISTFTTYFTFKQVGVSRANCQHIFHNNKISVTYRLRSGKQALRSVRSGV